MRSHLGIVVFITEYYLYAPKWETIQVVIGVNRFAIKYSVVVVVIWNVTRRKLRIY